MSLWNILLSRRRSEEEARELAQAGYRYALALTHHHHDAEDIVQQAWLRCLSRYGEVRERRVLFTTIRNLVCDQMRRGSIMSFEPIETGPHGSEPLAGENNVGASHDLDLLLSTLRVEEREALYLNVVEGHTAREIAARTGAPRNTVLSLIHRARKKLAQANAMGARDDIRETTSDSDE